jgi:hypothetical protein
MGWIGCIRCNKIPTQLHGTNFCTTLGRFALSFVTQPNCPKYIQIVGNAPNYEVRVQWGGSGAFVAKNSDTTSWHKLFHHFGSFWTEFLRHPNGTKCTQIVWNTPKHKFRSQQGQSGVFVAKNYDATSWHKLLLQFGPFCTEFCKATKRSKMHPNCTKHT